MSDRNWVVLTKDQAIGRDPLELQAVARSNAKVFVLVSAKLNRQQLADLFAGLIHKLQKFAQSTPAPFIAKVYKNGRITLWKNRTTLQKRSRIPNP